MGRVVQIFAYVVVVVACSLCCSPLTVAVGGTASSSSTTPTKSSFRVGSNTVQDITSFDDLKQIVTRDNEAFLLLVGDSLDLNSVRLRLLADEVAAELHGFITVAFLDVRVAEVDFVLSAWNVQAIPSWKLLPPARNQRANGLGATKTPMDYTESTMTVDTLKRFALQAVPAKGLVDRIDKDMDLATLHAAVAKSGVNVSLLITDKDKAPSVLYRRLAHKYVQRVAFADVVASKCPKLSRALLLAAAKGSGDEDKKRSSSPELPVVVVYNPSTKGISQFSGALNINSLSDWLSEFAVRDEDYQLKRTLEREAIIEQLSSKKKQ